MQASYTMVLVGRDPRIPGLGDIFSGTHSISEVSFHQTTVDTHGSINMTGHWLAEIWELW